MPIKTVYEWRQTGRGPVGIRMVATWSSPSPTCATGSGTSAGLRRVARRSSGDLPWQARPRTSIGSFGAIEFTNMPNGNRSRTPLFPRPRLPGPRSRGQRHQREVGRVRLHRRWIGGSAPRRLMRVVTLAEQETVGVLHCLPPRLNGGSIELGYRGTGHDGSSAEFTEVIELPAALDQVAPETRGPLLRLLSLAASLSYFKAFAPGRIEVAGGLTTRERQFLDELTKNGLGEFAYLNELPEVFQTRIAGPTLREEPTSAGESPVPQRVLVAVGGGKDSIVSIEALKTAGYEVGLFSVNGYKPIEDTAVAAGIPLQTARRRLDPELFRLNAEGAPNGHVPVTAVNSVIAVLTALALGYDTVAFSNEASSSYGNVVWHGRTVNHQWSKGLEFERLLRASLPAGAPTYVSLLRPLTELRIARRFAEHRGYQRSSPAATAPLN